MSIETKRLSTKKLKLNYKLGVQKMDNKDYLNAIDDFKKVDRQDSKKYNTALNKINECKKLYIYLIILIKPKIV